jgi:hypothetical protein
MSTHRQVPVKVNALVDDGIAELVTALSDIGLITTESCQGNPGTRSACVYFRARSWTEAGEFLFEVLLPELPNGVDVSVKGYGNGFQYGLIEMHTNDIPTVTKIVRNLPWIPTTMTRDSHGRE